MGLAEAVQFVILILAPAAIFAAGLMLPRTVRLGRRRWRGRTGRRRGQRSFDLAMPSRPPIEFLAADIRRLLRRHEAVLRSTDVAVRARHLHALEAAIGDCAAQAAEALGVTCPQRPTHGALPTPELRRLLRSLAEAGLVLEPATGLLGRHSL